MWAFICMASSNSARQPLMNFSLTTTLSPRTRAEVVTPAFLRAWLTSMPTSSWDRELGSMGWGGGDTHGLGDGGVCACVCVC